MNVIKSGKILKMQINSFQLNNQTITEIITPEIIIKTPQDAIDLMSAVPPGNIVLYKHNFEKDFFDLETGKAGEILQKFTNYYVKLAIIGDFTKYKSRSFQDFIYESNKRKHYLFVSSLEEIKRIWGEWAQ